MLGLLKKSPDPGTYIIRFGLKVEVGMGKEAGKTLFRPDIQSYTVLMPVIW